MKALPLHGCLFFILTISLIGCRQAKTPEFVVARDYEAEARAITRPNFPEKWPIEFHILIMEGLLQDLARSTFDLGAFNTPYFANSVVVSWGRQSAGRNSGLGVTTHEWEMTPTQELNNKDAQTWWHDLFRDFLFLERSKIKVYEGKVVSNGKFETAVSLGFAGKTADGFRRLSGHAQMTFTRTDGRWHISSFRLTDMKSARLQKKMFADNTSRWLNALPDDRYDAFQKIKGRRKGLGAEAGQSHPGVAIVDIDGDSWDDVFAWDHMNRSVLLLNRKDECGKRHFIDKTKEYGLDLFRIGMALFADFDNNGTVDAFLGYHQAKPARIIENLHSGKRRSKPVSKAEWITTASAADVDQDGFLDLAIGSSRSVAQRDTVFARKSVGTVLMLNQKGQWRDVTSKWNVSRASRVLQLGFGYADDDSAPDLFVANDFGPGFFFRNQGSTFADESQKTGAAQIYFGMGISWGDYDNDGDLDAYFSTMYSSAGKRINKNHRKLSAGQLEVRSLSARGNTLLRNEGNGNFVDATKGKALSNLRKAGWAYGAQFIDINNDSWLDIYSPNGFWSVPLADPGDTRRDT